MKWMAMLGAMLLAGLFAGGCATPNNYRECGEFFDFLVRNNVAVSKAQPLSPEPFRATSGMAFEVDGVDGGADKKIDIAIYKFNQDVELTRDRLKEIRKSGCVYLVGLQKNKLSYLHLKCHRGKAHTFQAAQEFPCISHNSSDQLRKNKCDQNLYGRTSLQSCNM